MPDVNMKYLRTFLIQVEERSTSKTARLVGLIGAGVLGHISALEKSVGVRLLQRRFPPKYPETGRTQLTQAGRRFLPKAMEAMHAHDRMFAEASSELDLREFNRIISTRLLEIALDALRHDLPDEDCDRLYDGLLDRTQWSLAAVPATSERGCPALQRSGGRDDAGVCRTQLTDAGALSPSVHNRAVTVLGFSPRLSLVREERDTKARTLDYKRNRAAFSFVRQF